MNFAENCDDWRAMLYQDKDQPTSKSMVTVWMYRPPYILAKAIDMKPDTLPPSKKSVPSSSQNESSLLNFQLGTCVTFSFAAEINSEVAIVSIVDIDFVR